MKASLIVHFTTGRLGPHVLKGQWGTIFSYEAVGATFRTWARRTQIFVDFFRYVLDTF